MRPPPGERPDASSDRFEAIYAANFDPILGYVLRRTENGDDAADIVAETFLTAWRRLDDVPEGDRARLWLYGVARRVLANHYRRVRKHSELSERLRAELAGVYRAPEFTGELARIAAAIRSLPEADRELIGLVAWEGLDSSQIATVLGCSANAVRIRLHRARKKLSKFMAHGDGAPSLESEPTLASVAEGEPA